MVPVTISTIVTLKKLILLGDELFLLGVFGFI